jgi:hypothetical protein
MSSLNCIQQRIHFARLEKKPAEKEKKAREKPGVPLSTNRVCEGSKRGWEKRKR